MCTVALGRLVGIHDELTESRLQKAHTLFKRPHAEFTGIKASNTN